MNSNVEKKLIKKGNNFSFFSFFFLIFETEARGFRELSVFFLFFRQGFAQVSILFTPNCTTGVD